MNKPFLSICIPTFNRPEYLRNCLLSLVKGVSAATLEKIEIVIADNSDNDETRAMVDGFRETFPRISYIKNETNIGGPHNLFKALSLGEGRYLWLMGDDDLVVAGKLDLIIEKLSLDDYSAAILNFAQGDGRNPEIVMLDNCLDLKDDKVFYGRDDLFAGRDFVNFFALNFMSALVYSREEFNAIQEQASEFAAANDCYPQSYAFLLVAAKDKPIIRISDVCVLWRSPETSRRYDTWQKDESHIFEQYLGYVRYARELGFKYDDAYLEETIRFKAINLFYFKKSAWKTKVKAVLAKLKLEKPLLKIFDLFRYLKYILKKK